MGRNNLHRFSNTFTIKVMLLFMIAAVPSLWNLSIKLSMMGSGSDINLYQILVFCFFFLTILRKKVHVTLNDKILIILLILIILSNTITAVFMEHDSYVPLMRGIFNFFVNTLSMLLLYELITNRESAVNWANMVVMFGVIVACSALFEFALSNFSAPMLIKWRKFIWGGIETDILRAGGSIYRDIVSNRTDLTRVGGIIGAPENLGMVLALTLPYLFFVRFSTVGLAIILSIYCGAAVASGSRTLGIALFFYFISLLKLRQHISKKIVVLITLIISLGTVSKLDINSPVLIRVSEEAILHEWEWRKSRFLDLLEVVETEDFNNVTGPGLGWGIEETLGLRPFTSGILGGDFAIAWATGRLMGVCVLTGIWVIVLRVWKRIKRTENNSNAAMILYITLLASLSLITPVLMQLVLSSGLMTLLILSFLVFVEKLNENHQHRKVALPQYLAPSGGVR